MMTRTDALIVGAGPVGLSLAILLKKQSLSVRVVERRDGPQRAPAAHVLNARTFEIWRQCGLDVDRIRAAAQSSEDAGRVYWVDKLGGNVFGSLQYEQQGDDQLANSPTPLRNLSQHILEPMLLEEAQRAGVAVEYGVEWTPEMSSEATWLLGCDGASSAVRRSIDIEMIGPDNLQRFHMIHFRADLSSMTHQARGVLYWLCDPSIDGTLISHGKGGEWVYMTAANDDVQRLDESDAIQRVRNVLTQPDVPMEILTISSWTMTSQIASSYRADTTFLVGDSAHRFPPSGGMGLNSGVADAHNLAWKIGAVHHGKCDSSILDTYEPERRPVAERNAQASLENAFRMIEVFEALPTGDVEKISEAISHQATHFDMLGLQIGYRYRLTDADPELEPLTDEVIRTYSSVAQVGKRLPHCWLVKDGHTISSLDLIPLDGYVTIGGPEALTPVDIQVGRDVEDPSNGWANALNLPPDAILTVRPDQHIESIR
jgi:2-polyprenyl-6-methoxyphenol hydroxylase-like FAD-dependent oxidoreductase